MVSAPRCCLIGLALATLALAQVPDRPATYMMNSSTIIMPCNNSGYTDPSTTLGWGVVDFDWSNAKGKGTADGWVKHKPMDDEEMLFKQVQMTTAATANATVWVYRCSVYAYPWYTSVRAILDDAAYSDWFVKFKPTGPWYSPKCDNNYDPPLCSDYFHMQEQSPGYPHGDGDCAAPACDCGTKPCGFYLFNHSSTTVVKGQTFQDWFIHSYMFNAVGQSPLVSGFFWDDVWPANGRWGDAVPNVTEDTGLTPQELVDGAAAWTANMAALQNHTLSVGKFSWQMLWTGGDPEGRGSTCPNPLVARATCASSLRAFCQADAVPQRRTMMYAFGPGSCSASGHKNPVVPVDLHEDLANFLLIRGPYAYLGHGWLGCSKFYVFPPELNVDYGEPTELCHETAPGSEVFVREWTKSTVQMDCKVISLRPRLMLPHIYSHAPHASLCANSHPPAFAHTHALITRVRVSAANYKTFTPTITMK